MAIDRLVTIMSFAKYYLCQCCCHYVVGIYCAM